MNYAVLFGALLVLALLALGAEYFWSAQRPAPRAKLSALDALIAQVNAP